ncbi:exodeoxyribonuclease-3 [Mobilisporobacter senegalensis]|uniref:Exodeoxyribonuclease-3 n=1 Tax=Mobilisporobacter senegalensis TaxID=1329262 RepID=A0A3N1X9X1_9FIRM|nr:exodeoxyribonuclease III [Mobilisporobacter senegalensis]ROR21762.1 exodeoxyribonuclease-3 [Mobilisporobacter senegalensis]
MKLISWNVNGLRACLTKGFEDFFTNIDADMFCLQETKMQPEQMEKEFTGYYQFWNSAVKKGYSGTAIFTKVRPISVAFNFEESIKFSEIENITNEEGIPNLFYDKKEVPRSKYDDEGRVITLEFEDYYLVTVYTPNAKRGLERIDYRMDWEIEIRNYLLKLDEKKPVIICGDLNVAHQEIDLKNPKSNVGNAGFSDEEREKMTELLASGFTDSFRHLYPDKTDAYTWWSYMFKAREKNVGWRIDYFLVSERIKDKIKDSIIHADILGSDHCPIELEI